jgi:hypothetical protein
MAEAMIIPSRLNRATAQLLLSASAARTYFFSAAPGAGELLAAGRSEFQMSVPHFHVPPFFSQTSQYLPRSFVPSFMVNS